MRYQKNPSLDGFPARGGQEGFDHITIYPPDRLGLPPRGMCRLCHVSTYINKLAVPHPHSPNPWRRGQGPAPEPYPRSFLLACPPLTLSCTADTARPQ